MKEVSTSVIKQNVMVTKKTNFNYKDQDFISPELRRQRDGGVGAQKYYSGGF